MATLDPQAQPPKPGDQAGPAVNAPPDVTVYWRPGCGFCRRLRRGLDRAGVDRTEINIWRDPAAAAVVRPGTRQ